jgi:hypothetical protein
MIQKALPSLVSNQIYQIYSAAFYLKGHGNEADFLKFLQKSVPRESLTLLFDRFSIRIRGKFGTARKVV